MALLILILTIDEHLSLFLFFYETIISSLNLAHKFVFAHTYLFTFSRGNTMKEITFSSLKSSLTNKHHNFKFMLTDILLKDCPLKKKKKKEHYWISQVDMKSKVLRFCSRVFVCVVFFFFLSFITPLSLCHSLFY